MVKFSALDLLTHLGATMVMLVMMTGLMVLAPASAQDACTATLSSHRFAFNDPFPLVDDGDSPARSWYIKTPSMLRRCFNEFPLNPQVRQIYVFCPNLH